MGTFGCINDMLHRDKENRALRKRSRERITETRRRLMDCGKSTDTSRMTLGQLEEIRRKTSEKEESDKASFRKALLGYAVVAVLCLLLVWWLVG